MRVLEYIKRPFGFACNAPDCGWTITHAEIRSGRVSANILQDHAHLHRANSVKIIKDDYSNDVEAEIVEK